MTNRVVSLIANCAMWPFQTKAGLPKPRPTALPYSSLAPLAENRSREHSEAKPYAHSVFDNFLSADSIARIATDIPSPGKAGKWDRYFAAGLEDKWAISDEASLPNALHQLVLEMNSSRFIVFLEKLSGIDHLLPDPHLEGAGLHLVPSGGVLQVHADFNYSKRLNAYRRVNVFLYLNARWEDEWGGALELWDSPHGSPIQTIAPRFNRLVVFNSSSDTFHGHPHPIVAPKGQWRTSLAMYYYTSSPPEGARDAHNTVYKGVHV
jgi:Rps23 Pro-64 3,4-dihydroxylase Tpa1-like proline 4-hydroxylase